MKHNKILKIIKNVIINTLIFLLGVIAILAIWASIQLNVQNKEYVNIFGYSIFSTATGSMSPTIQKGDIVFVKIGEQIQEDDIITYKQNNNFITHRIVKIDEDTIVARGDYNNAEDETITKDSVLGKVVFFINNVEVWKKVFSDISVIIPIVITVILLVVLVSYNDKRKDDIKDA